MLLFFLITLVSAPGNPASATTITFAGGEFLGKPTDTSITINIVPATSQPDIEYYYVYDVDQGTVPGDYDYRTPNETATAGNPSEVVITNLEPNTRYYYRMVYDGDGDVDDGDYELRDEHNFHTQRAEGEPFVFTVTSDSHANFNTTHQIAMTNILNDQPDFNLDLGDTFYTDNQTSQSAVNTDYLDYRRVEYMGRIGPSVPIFLTAGNHENEEGWNFDDAFNLPLASIQARKTYFPTPIDEGPDGFYSGNTDPLAEIDETIYGDEFREDYYAWEWGDALFVVLDEYQYTMDLPYTPIAGEGNEPVTGDQWSWTLGQQQYNWFKDTLENSNAKYKFVFSHHVTGGILTGAAGAGAGYVRGGAGAAPYFEWGGKNADGTDGFEDHRPGWGGVPIHQLMVANGVSAYFHGHDHQYVYEELDGIVYQEVPSPSMQNSSGFAGIYSEADDFTIRILPSAGHLRLTVNPTVATVEYITSNNTSAAVQYTYTIEPNEVTTDPTITVSGTPLSAFTSVPGSPSAEQIYSVSGTNLTGNITIIPPIDFQISLNNSDWTSNPSFLTLAHTDGTVTATPIYVRFNRATEGTSNGNITHSSSEAAPQIVALNGTASIGGTGTVTLDGSYSSGTADGVSSINVSHTTGTGANRLMLVGVSSNSYNGAQTISSVTFTPSGESAIDLGDPVGMQENEAGRLVAIYSLINPPAGVSGTVTVNYSGTVSYGIVVGVQNFAGVDQDDPLDGFVSAVGTESSPISVNVTADTNDLVFDTVFIGAATIPALTAGSNQDQLWSTNVDRAGGAASTELATSTVTMSWTATGGATTYYWAIGAVPINPAREDTIKPTVTINQAAGQNDPTSVSPINFTVTFSEPVSDFATGDVSLGGSAPGTLTGTVTGSSTTFNVAVSGMTGSGTVTASITAGVAHDMAGNPNEASTSTDNTVTVNTVITTHYIELLEGWNLVSFNVQPVDTGIAAVLSSIDGNYDLVYAWDATGAHSTSGNWMKFAPADPPYANSLDFLDISIGFWIHMTTADILEVEGTIQETTGISLLIAAGGWNLVGYPASINRALPGALSDHGVGTDFSLIYTYHAKDADDPWKLFDRTGVPYANDLTELSSGWGYWVMVSADHSWNVSYLAE